MLRIRYNITPHHLGMCSCEKFLQPLKTWKEIAKRHNSYRLMSRDFVYVSDNGEDWSVDLFRCKDCGRYWAREDCGVVRSYAFFYFVGTNDPEELLEQATNNTVLWRLNQQDEDFQILIAPQLKI